MFSLSMLISSMHGHLGMGIFMYFVGLVLMATCKYEKAQFSEL